MIHPIGKTCNSTLSIFWIITYVLWKPVVEMRLESLLRMEFSNSLVVSAKVKTNQAALGDLGARFTFGRNPGVVFKKQTRKHGWPDNQLSLGHVISVELMLQPDVGWNDTGSDELQSISESKVQMYRWVMRGLMLCVHNVLPHVFSTIDPADARRLCSECNWGVYYKLNQTYLHPWLNSNSGVDVFKETFHYTCALFFSLSACHLIKTSPRCCNNIELVHLEEQVLHWQNQCGKITAFTLSAWLEKGVCGFCELNKMKKWWWCVCLCRYKCLGALAPACIFQQGETFIETSVFLFTLWQ